MFNKQTFLKRKYFFLTGTFLLLILLLGILEPVILNYDENNWDKNLTGEISKVKKEAASYFAGIEKRLNDKGTRLAEILKNENNRKNFADVINAPEWSEYSILITRSDYVPVASGNFNSAVDSVLVKKNYKGIYFLETPLFDYLSVKKVFSTAGKEFVMVLSIPVEKKYLLNTSYFKNISIKEELAKKFKTNVEVFNNEAAPEVKDGRQFKTEIINSAGEKVLTLVIENPSLSVELNKKRELISFLQIICLFAVILLLLKKIKLITEKIINRPARNFFVIFIIAALRVVLFIFEIPTRFITSELTDASNFSSAFGYGIVRSPLDLFLTILSILGIALLLYDSVKSLKKELFADKKIIRIILLPALVIFYFLFLRAFGASIRSVVWDSTLKYFKDPFIIPDLPLFVMHLNILLIGLSTLIIASSILLFFLKAAGDIKLKAGIYLFFLLQAAGLLFDIVQSDPQGNDFTRVVYIAFTFIAAYLVLQNKFKSVFEYSVYLLLASFLSILLLIFYNKNLEKNSLSLTANEFIKGNEKLNEFVAIQTAIQFSKDPELISMFESGGGTFNQEAFKLWSKSVLPKEILSVHLSILDKNLEELGHYDYNFDSHNIIDWKLENGKEYYVKNATNPFNGRKMSLTLAPVKAGNKLLGFIELAMHPVNDYFNRRLCYNILSSHSQKLNSTVDFSQLKVFLTSGSEIKNSIGDISLRKEDIDELNGLIPIEGNEMYLEKEIDGKLHLMFVRRAADGIIGVALRTRDLTIDLFDFFKVFFIHSIIILFFTLIAFLSKIKMLWQTLFNFRARLLYALIIISIVPLFLSAIYFKTLVENKNIEDVNYKLNRRALQVDRYLKNYFVQSTLAQNEVFEKAHRDLGVEYSIFDSDKLIYTTLPGFYKSTLLSGDLNSVVKENLFAKKGKQFLIYEQIDDYNFNSFYLKTAYSGRDLVININNAFNEVNLSLSNLEVDIFLFGSYSFAAVLIILLSSFLAGQISKPIRELTRATIAVAEGDLDVKVKYKVKGEMNNLIFGFNEMVEKLKRSQLELAEFERETAWKEMARQVAHEIKNPLTPMKLSIQQLVASYNDKSPKFNSIFEKVTSTIIGQIETLNKIASEFSGFARMPRMNIEKVDLIKICREAVNLFDSDLKINISIASPQVEVMADSDHLKRSFINLIRNSIQAGATKMEIRIFHSAENAEIRFIDNGRGIEKEYVEKIFDENFTTKERGMGLGLSMAKKYFELLNGSISVEQTSGKGTTILIIIPGTGVK